MRKRVKAILAAAVVSVLSCAGLFVARYSEEVDRGAVELQQKVDGFLTELQNTAGTAEGDYEGHEQFYGEVHDDIDVLRTAAASQRGNSLTLQSLDLIADNVDALERMHAKGITPNEVAVARQLLDAQFRMLVQLENAKKREETP